jgi:hypothetical protein
MKSPEKREIFGSLFHVFLLSQNSSNTPYTIPAIKMIVSSNPVDP